MDPERRAKRPAPVCVTHPIHLENLYPMGTMSLTQITAGGELRPPRIVVYGVHGIGKTTLAAAAPRPVALRTEDGLGTLSTPTFPIARSYGEVLDAIKELYIQPHEFQTLFIDSLDWLEPLVWAHTAMLGGKQDIEDFGYGKGYTKAGEHWQAILEGLNALRNDRGMTIICLAHSEIKRFDSPETEPFDRYQIKLHKRAADLVQEWADVVGFAHYEVFTTGTETGFNKTIRRGVGSGQRLLSVEERPAFYAKNRYQLPPSMPLSWDVFVDAYATTLRATPAAPAPASSASLALAEEEPVLDEMVGATSD